MAVQPVISWRFRLSSQQQLHNLYGSQTKYTDCLKEWNSVDLGGRGHLFSQSHMKVVLCLLAYRKKKQLFTKAQTLQIKINVMIHCYKSNILIFSLSVSVHVKPWHLQWRKTAEIDRLTCSQGLIKLLRSLRMVPVLRASGFSLWKWSLCGGLLLRPPAVIVVGVQERTWMRADQRNSLLLFSNSFTKRGVEAAGLSWISSVLGAVMVMSSNTVHLVCRVFL